MKEKMISTAAGRTVKSPTKSLSIANLTRPVSKSKSNQEVSRAEERPVSTHAVSTICLISFISKYKYLVS